MNGKQMDRWLRRRFSPMGWLLLAYYGLMTLLTALSGAADSARQTVRAFLAGDFSGYVDWDAIYSNAWGYVAAVLVSFAILSAWKGRDYWKQQVFVKSGTMKFRTFGCFLLLCMGAQMANTVWITVLELVMNLFGGSVMPILESVSGDSDTFSMFLYASILAPIWEELLFRGCVLRSLRPYGKRFAIFGSAVLFGLFHGNLLQAPYALLMGLALGYVTVEYSIRWSILLHMFNNLVLADLLTRLTASWSDMAYGTLNAILFGGGAVLSVCILCVKRREIRAYRKGEWMDRRCVKCLFTSPGILALAALMLGNMIALLWV